MKKYFFTILKGLEINSSIYLNTTLDKVWKYLLYLNLFFNKVSKDIISIPNENEISLYEVYELNSKSENSKFPILITSYIVTDIIISSSYAKVTYNTYEKISFPSIKLSFSIKKLDIKNIYFQLI